MERIDWDEFAERYDKSFLQDPLYNDSLRMLVERVTDMAAPRVLDLGCGTGGVTYQLLKMVPDARVTGVDPSAPMREVYAVRFAGNSSIEVLEGDGLNIPARGEEFDFVLSNLALHHIPHEDKPACAREIARVLKKGGRLAYCDHFCDIEAPRDDPARCRDIIEKTIGWALYSLESGAYDHALGLLRVLPLCIAEEGEYLETPGRWAALLADAGFGPLDVLGVPPADVGMKVLTAAKC
jgi:ubiquinone/menaquinone biosynthesis C-methylase UbiE